MASTPSAADDVHVFSVSELNRTVRDVLETAFGPVWVAGELSNLARPASGHMYFSLKDADAQVRCAMFRGRNRLLEFTPEAGMMVRARARIGLYERRGDYQLIVEQLEPWGAGALAQAFERLKKRLDAEGLFSAERKRALPTMPARIGVITSATGAAVRDVLRVLRHRFPAVPVILYPVPVQGEQAAGAIARMIEHAGERGDCDVLLLVRGGGSLEDLWAFNEEAVARAIAASMSPSPISPPIDGPQHHPPLPRPSSPRPTAWSASLASSSAGSSPPAAVALRERAKRRRAASGGCCASIPSGGCNSSPNERMSSVAGWPAALAGRSAADASVSRCSSNDTCVRVRCPVSGAFTSAPAVPSSACAARSPPSYGDGTSASPMPPVPWRRSARSPCWVGAMPWYDAAETATRSRKRRPHPPVRSSISASPRGASRPPSSAHCPPKEPNDAPHQRSANQPAICAKRFSVATI